MKTDFHTVMKAINFACNKHSDQLYGLLPYSYHCQDVAKYANKFGVHYFGESSTLHEAIVVAWLHDTLEDTTATYEEIEHIFGTRIAYLVDNLTDPPGFATRKERKAAGYAKIKYDRISVFVKLADRIANTATGGKIDMYRKEFPRFRAELYTPGLYEDMWDYLDTLTNGEIYGEEDL